MGKIIETPKNALLSITEFETTERNIRAYDLVFHDNSKFSFSEFRYSYVTISANFLKFNSPQLKSTVTLGNFPIDHLTGETGVNGIDATSDDNGGDGRTGGKGQSQPVPDIYLFINEMETDIDVIPKIDWTVMAQGVQGGRGGKGGQGGKGGKGKNGSQARVRVDGCHGGGDGKRGGDGGRGGRGGDGGDGSDGGDIFIIANSDVIKKMSYFKYINNGGSPGEGGYPGNSGEPGEGGDGGKSSGGCGGGDHGKPGNVLQSLGFGLTGAKGKRGNIYYIDINDLGNEEKSMFIEMMATK